MRRLLGIAGLLIACAAAVPQADAHKVPRLSLAQVLDQLRRDIAAVPASDPRPIDTVMKRHADTRGQSFDIASPDPEEAPSEAVPPPQPAGLTDAEWHALQAYRAHTTSEADDIAENRSHHYTLIDLDEDGQRDLLDDAYVGGTGLFTQITVLQGHTDGFRAATATPTGTLADREADAGFSINGRGGDQALYWLRIDGRSYAAYRDGDYFQDTLTLSRPLSPLPAERRPTQALQIRYRYQHTLAAARKDAAERLPEERQADDWLAQHPALRAAVDTQLQHLRLDAQGRQRSPDPQARCPIPAESSDPELEAQWPWHDAGHYTFDVCRQSSRAPRQRLLQRQRGGVPQQLSKHQYRVLCAVALRRTRQPGCEPAATVKAHAQRHCVDHGSACGCLARLTARSEPPARQ